MAQAQLAHQAAEELGSVAGAVVGHDAPHLYPEASVIAQRMRSARQALVLSSSGCRELNAMRLASLMATWANFRPVPPELLAVACHSVVGLSEAPPVS